MRLRMTPAFRALTWMRTHPAALDVCGKALRLNTGPRDERRWSELEEDEREMWRRRVLARQLALVRSKPPTTGAA